MIQFPFRDRAARLWPRLRPWFRWLGLLTAVAAVVILAEAAVRARLVAPADRVPTMLISRPVPWGEPFAVEPPVPVAPLAEGLEEWRMPVYLDELPDHLVSAVLAVEDQRFFRHRGLDFRRIVGAAAANARAGGVAQGGSTITQQLVKNLFLTARRTPLRKLREAALALHLEDRYDKDRILEAYLNEIYLGQAGGRAIHGVGAAARYYFAKDAGKLTAGESALLAGMIRAPNRYTPFRHTDRARERRELVLRLMVAQERIDQREARRAGRERLPTRPAPSLAGDARYFRDFVVSRLRDEGVGRLPDRGAVVYTSLDPALQRAAERSVREELGRLRSPDAEAALVALDPHTGEVLAMVGGRDYGASQFNRATEARRQPGSAFKAIVALAALGRNGGGDPAYTLATKIEDEPLAVATDRGEWEPANYDGDFRGDVTLRKALEQSLNVPIARVGMTIGPKRIAETGKRLGIESQLRAVPSLALGASEVTPLELTRAYGVLAAGGVLAPTRTVLGVGHTGARVVMTQAAPAEQVADSAEVYLVTSALEGAVLRGTGRGLLRLGRRQGLAGKSGTTSDWRDGWFVAYTPWLVVGVWVGHDDGRPLNLTGSRSALPIVASFLGEALRRDRSKGFPVPGGIELVRLEKGGWWIFGGGCSDEAEAFLAGTAPESDCGPLTP